MARRGSWEDADPADDPMPNTMAVNLGPTVRGRPCRLLAACLACLAASAAVAEPRVALVVGNNAYEEAPLDNPLSDAKLIEGTLRELGFEVSTARDADEDAMEEAIVRLGERLRELGRGCGGSFLLRRSRRAVLRGEELPDPGRRSHQRREQAGGEGRVRGLGARDHAQLGQRGERADSGRLPQQSVRRPPGRAGPGGDGAGLGLPDRVLGRRRADRGRRRRRQLGVRRGIGRRDAASRA